MRMLINKEWLKKMIELEEGMSVEVGVMVGDSIEVNKENLINFVRQLEPTDTEIWCDQTVAQVADSIEIYFSNLEFDKGNINNT